MCNKEIGSNSIKCLVCGFWVHKCFSNIKGPLKTNPDLKCKKCRGEVSNATIPDINPVHINGEEIRKVRYFCYLGDFIGKCGGCFNTTTARVTSAWKFRALFPILTCHGLSLKTHTGMPTMDVCIVSYCMPMKHGLEHSMISPTSTAMIWWWNESAPWSLQIPSNELKS